MKPPSSAGSVAPMLAALRCKRQAWEMLGQPALPIGVEQQVRRDSRRRLVTAALDAMAPTAQRNIPVQTASVSLRIDALDNRRTLIAVRPGATLRSHHVERIALQWWALQNADVPVERCTLIHLNPSHCAPGPEPLFLTQDITSAIRTAALRLGPKFAAFETDMVGDAPKPEPGPHCTRPRPCAQFAKCRGPAKEHSISELYRVKERVLKRLRSNGIERIDDIPRDFPLPPIADRQRRAVQSGNLVVDAGLAGALARIAAPVAFIDFEAVQPAVPLWAGCRPFEAVPVQVSVHAQDEEGTVRHLEWMASGPGDPRPALAAFLAPIAQATRTFVAYYSPFEQNMLTLLAAGAVQEHREALMASTTRFVDLLPLVRDHVYHPHFRGRFSLKTVVGALLPDLSYDNLAVNRGDLASLLLEEVILADTHELDHDLRTRRAALLAYCRRDTWALVELVRLLSSLQPVGHEST